MDALQPMLSLLASWPLPSAVVNTPCSMIESAPAHLMGHPPAIPSRPTWCPIAVQTSHHHAEITHLLRFTSLHTDAHVQDVCF